MNSSTPAVKRRLRENTSLTSKGLACGQMVHNAKVRHRVQDLIDHVDDAVGCDHVVALNPGSVDGHNILKQNDSMPATLRNRYMVLFRKK